MSIFKTRADEFNRASAAPKAPRNKTADNYHGQKIADPFRPLEKLDSRDTKKFVDAHNARFADFIGTSDAQKKM